MSLASDVQDTIASIFDDKVFPLVAQAGTVPPYATYQQVSGANETELRGMLSLVNARFQIDMFGRNHRDLDALAEQVLVAMDAAVPFKSIMQNKMDLFEDPSLLYHIMLDFSVWQDSDMTFEVREDGGYELRE